MANPTISISGFSLLPECLQAGTPFTATITAKNNLGATALYAYLTAHIDMEGLDPGDSGAGRVNLYSSGVQQISIANGASKALTFSGTISETAWDELNAILEKYPSAPIRRNAIIWTLHMDNGGFEYSADTIYNAGELLDAFYSPAIEAFRLERCMNGVPNDEGESLLSTIKLGLAEKARQALLSLKLYYSESTPATMDSDFIDLSSSIPDLIGGIADSAELISHTFGNTANWNFLLVFGDEYESAVAAFSLSRAFANMHLSGATTGGVAFGGFSTSGEGDPKLESHYPANFYSPIYLSDDLTLKNGKKFGWHPGDSITFPGVICFPGYITSSTSSVRFLVNVGGPIFASGVSFSGGVLIRTIKGYINSSSAAINVGASGYSWSTYGVDNAGGNICVMINKSSAFTNATNNTPIIAQSSNFTIKFT